jgi:hypothetical protein
VLDENAACASLCDMTAHGWNLTAIVDVMREEWSDRKRHERNQEMVQPLQEKDREAASLCLWLYVYLLASAVCLFDGHRRMQRKYMCD